MSLFEKILFFYVVIYKEKFQFLHRSVAIVTITDLLNSVVCGGLRSYQLVSVSTGSDWLEAGQSVL